jgi:hypothetical protein
MARGYVCFPEIAELKDEIQFEASEKSEHPPLFLSLSLSVQGSYSKPPLIHMKLNYKL